MIDDEVTKVAAPTLVTLALAWITRGFIARLSKDSADRAEDRGRKTFIEQQAERIAALEETNAILATERNEAASRVGGLESDLRSTRERCTYLEARVTYLEGLVYLPAKPPDAEA